MIAKQHIDFHIVTVADKPLFDYYMLSSGEQNCDLNFANIFCWSDTYHSEVGEAEGFLVIRFDIGGERCYMQPVGGGDRRRIVELLRQDAFEQRSPLRLYGLSAEWRRFLENNYPDEFAFDAPRALCDYIYRVDDLAQLPGRRYQPKRNHINRFVAQYKWHTEPLSTSNIKECVALYERWLSGREMGETEYAEQHALQRAFDNFEPLGLRGLVLYGDGRVVAFSYGTPISQHTFCTHIEKHDNTIEGASTMINRLMAQSLEGEFEFVNREDDLGLEGLRFAKMSYYPAILLDKISALHLTPEQREMREMWQDIFGDERHEIDSFLIRHTDAVQFIHKDGDEVVSMLFVVPLRMWEQRVAYIYAVATKPKYRGRGLASALLNEALCYIRKSDNYDCAALIPSSIESKELYSRLGFVDSQIPMHFPATDYLGTGSEPHDLAMICHCNSTK